MIDGTGMKKGRGTLMLREKPDPRSGDSSRKAKCRSLLNDDYKQSVIDLMFGIQEAGVENYIVPHTYAKYFQDSKPRYTIVINHYVLYRTKENLAATATTGVFIGIVRGWMVVPIEADSYFEYCVIDTRSMKVVLLYNMSHIEDDPVDGKIILKHVSRMLDDMISVGKFK
jgi:hypothetical protein